MKDFLISLSEVRETVLKVQPLYEATQLAASYEPTPEWRVAAMTFLRQQRHPKGVTACLIISIPKDEVFTAMIEDFCSEEGISLNLQVL